MAAILIRKGAALAVALAGLLQVLFGGGWNQLDAMSYHITLARYRSINASACCYADNAKQDTKACWRNLGLFHH
jgi:hypothetical protein